MPEDSQASWYWDEGSSTKSKEWSELTPIPPLRVATQGQASAVFSAHFSGGPAQLRLRAGKHATVPARVQVRATRGDVSTFVFATTSSLDAGCHVFRLEWRAPSGNETTVSNGTMVLHYQDGSSMVQPRICD